MPKAQDLTNKRFSRLVAIRRIENTKYNHVRWLCKCNCGKEIKVTANHLRSGHTRSCGCYQVEKAIKGGTKHSMTRTPEWYAWQNIRKRCFDKTNKHYRFYGGRGITVCERWLKFENFYEDMGSRPSPKHSIDRINNDGDYEPKNCRWATTKEQARNTSRNLNYSHKGKEMCLQDIVDMEGLSYSKVYHRIKRGWSFEEAIK